MRKIANHVCVTNQVLCSSCQGIYIDTNDDEVLLNKAKIFFEIFKEEKRKVGGENLGMIGKNTFQLYSKSLEENNEDIDFNDEGVSVVVKKDSELELSYMFRNVWIKKLPKDKIVKTLHKHKNHLQTVALFVNETERELIKNILVSAGVTKITSLESNIDNSYESHDGEYPLLRYSKVIEDK